MIHVCMDSCPEWADAMMTALQGYQLEVDTSASYTERVSRAKDLWDKRRQNQPLQQAASMLRDMCSSNYCMFCEHSEASEIEHFRPKALYPELVFAWANFLYGCSICNRRKGSRFKIYRGNESILDVARKRNTPLSPPETGEPLLIDPRHEDPLDLIELELRTGWFLERYQDGLRHERAKFTIELLGLNQRDHILRARRDTFFGIQSSLRDIRALKREGAPWDSIARVVDALRGRQHRTVWEEMKRQHESIPELSRLFQELPEALSW